MIRRIPVRFAQTVSKFIRTNSCTYCISSVEFPGRRSYEDQELAPHGSGLTTKVVFAIYRAGFVADRFSFWRGSGGTARR